MTNVTSNNQLTQKAQIAKVTKTREFLVELRTTTMKNYPNGKGTNIREMIKKHGVPHSVVTWLSEINAIHEYAGATKGTAERYINWTYNKTENGVVDQSLIDTIIGKERAYMRAWHEKKRIEKAGDKEELQIQKQTNTLKKLPTGNTVTMDSIVLWVEEELTKEELIPGYLRSAQKLMYIKIKEVMNNIKPSIDKLKQAINEIEL